MKSKTQTQTQTESQTVKSMAFLTKSIETFYRIANNTDADTFKKEAIAFRDSLVGVAINKHGFYTIPKAYNQSIDAKIDGDYRSDRQAYKSSLVACFYLNKNGTDSKAFLLAGVLKASKNKISLEALTDFDWSLIKKNVKLAQRKAKATKTESVASKTESVASKTESVGVPNVQGVGNGMYNFDDFAVTPETLATMGSVKTKLESKHTASELACLGKMLVLEFFVDFHEEAE